MGARQRRGNGVISP